MDPIVELQAAGVSLGGHPVLRDLDLTLLPGQTVGVAGPNGSGKTTLVRTVATLVPIDEGELFLFGRRVDGRDLAAIRSSIGLIGHQPALIPELTLFENLVHVCRLTGVDEGRVGRALDVVGLAGEADRRAQACSFGMKRRVEIAHLLLTRPMLLLLDEASSGLDEDARGLVGTLVQSVRDRGGGCLVVSHDVAHLRELSTELARLENGTLEKLT
jgi:ABC-type multidrug transport system ATPase subunit